MEENLIDLGFKRETIGKYEYLCYGDTYCRITYIESFAAFVIESADNFTDAENGALEDGDLYYTDISEEEFLEQFKNDVIKYYID